MLTSAAAGAWLLQQAATLPDTIITKQVAQPRDWFNTVSGIASILISLALLALCVGLIPAAWNFRKSYGKINDLLKQIYGDVNPIMRHASTIADNVNYVTTSIRVDIQQVNQTIATANERLQEAVRLTERRVQEFNALLDVVQREAESTFVATAATLRGVREGAATFREEALGLPPRRGGGSDRSGRATAYGASTFHDGLAERLAELREEAAAETERYAEARSALEAAREGDLDHDVFGAALDEAFDEDDLGDRVEGELNEDEAYDDDNADDTRGSSDGYRRGVPPVGGGGGEERPRVRARGRRRPGHGGAEPRDAAERDS